MKHVVIPHALVLIWALVLSGPPAAADWSGTTADQMVSFDDNEDARFAQILGESSTLHLIWTEDAPSVREVHYGRSSDEGDTWTCSSADRVLSFPDGNAVYDKPSAAMDFGGRILVVWSEDDATTREIHYGISTDQGDTWSSQGQDQILSDPASAVEANPPSSAAGSDGVFHVVWTQNTGTVSEVHYSRSTDGGVSWSGHSGDRVISFPDGNNAIAPEIAIDGDNRLVVIWRETGDEGLPVIHAGCSTDGGNTWTSATTDHEISPPARLITSLALDAGLWGDGFHAVYTASFDTASPYHYEVYATQSLDGASWTGETALVPVSYDEDHTRSASNPDVFVGSCSQVVAVWDEQDEASGTQEQHYSQWINGAWEGTTADHILSFPDGEDGYRPSISGQRFAIPKREDFWNVWVAWAEFAGDATNNYEVHLSHSFLCNVGGTEDPAAVAGPIRVVPNPGHGAIRIEAAGSGMVAVEIFDAGGRLLRRLQGNGDASRAGGAAIEGGAVVWDGRDQSGRQTAPGLYWARIRTGKGTSIRSLVIL